MWLCSIQYIYFEVNEEHRCFKNELKHRQMILHHPYDDQSWMFIGRTDVEAETPILWPPHVRSWLICKDPDAEKDWREKKGTTEDEMVGWHHQPDGREFEQALVVGDGLLEFTWTHAHWVSDATQPSHPLSSPSPALNLSQYQSLFKWISSSHQVVTVLEFQLQHQSFQWTLRTDFL